MPEAQIQGILNNVQRQAQQFIADILDQEKPTLYRADDYKTMRGLIFEKVKKSVEKRFPLYNNKYVLAVEDVDYADPETLTYKDEKEAILNGKSVGRRLRGRYVLKDAATDKVISRTPLQTLLKVPYMTDRGTFIDQGHEYTFNNLLRLEPGAYSKRNNDDELTTQFNVKKGTGAGFNMKFTPSKGLFQINRGTANAPAYTVMKDLGVTDEQMKASWGDELFKLNKDYGSTEKARIAANKIYNYKG